MMRPARNGSWLCEDVLGKSCYEWVMKEAVYYATKQEIGNGSETRSIEDKCRRLEDGVRGSFLSSCGNLTGNERGWANVTAIPLTGPNAPEPPSQEQNQSSNCHPTLPKSNDLHVQ
ncbi:hypothetical protein BU26DRAFT_567893 [Trematosphaeria pertusa]|uniref:Uncharacterized protein n=1 Tax=Trematosphaeria pertusa TaxID=390896 RepID=A0A6A6I5H5_9PLEO|nr:uncharacterized protein BU26DRAFT_567893 [Trematosphaeria pertusa]KAF2245298.1 hypothetical protein BU26DRAFT_567893 [Trematosphaeria pertusa]